MKRPPIPKKLEELVPDDYRMLDWKKFHWPNQAEMEGEISYNKSGHADVKAYHQVNDEPSWKIIEFKNGNFWIGQELSGGSIGDIWGFHDIFQIPEAIMSESLLNIKKEKVDENESEVSRRAHVAEMARKLREKLEKAFPTNPKWKK